jgi:KDO2-lipid IV(A) lauroyltransferase
VYAPFFGEPALTMTLLPRLARRTGAAVLFVFVERLPRARGYRMHWLPAPEGIADADPVISATALNRGVEACVALCPEQYQWTYRRFKARPDGGPNRYRGRAG